MSFKVGDKFPSFSSWEEAVEMYEQENFVQLWRRDARNILAAKKRFLMKISSTMSFSTAVLSVDGSTKANQQAVVQKPLLLGQTASSK